MQANVSLKEGLIHVKEFLKDWTTQSKLWRFPLRSPIPVRDHGVRRHTRCGRYVGRSPGRFIIDPRYAHDRANTSAWIPVGKNSLNPLGGMSNWRNWPSLTVRLTTGRAKKQYNCFRSHRPRRARIIIVLNVHCIYTAVVARTVLICVRRTSNTGLQPHPSTRHAVSFFDHMVSYSGSWRTRKNCVRPLFNT